MIDIKLIRENKNEVITRLKIRGKDYDKTIDEISEIDENRRKLASKRDNLKFEQNTASKQISVKKSKGQDASALLDEMKKLATQIKRLNGQLSELENKQQNLLLNIPNMPHKSVNKGKDESDNQEITKWGEINKFDFKPKSHWDIGKDLDILDPQTAAKVTGSRFHFYRGKGAKLERAIVNFFLDTHAKNGYEEVLPPFIVNRSSMIGTGQLPKFEDDAFKIKDFDYFLIPTAEVPVTNIYRETIIPKANLPIKYCAYSACFRKEVGSAGKDVHGLIRQHQFNKVELVKFVQPENSYAELEKLLDNAKHVLKLLNLPFRVVNLCGGDLGFSAAKTYDIEVWMPSYNAYKEISSCSNFESFQARRANIRYKKSKEEKPQFVHTLNGSGVAVGRTVAAILENYQQKDGTVKIPDVLVDYMQTETID